MGVGVIKLTTFVAREVPESQRVGERTIAAALATSERAGARLEQWLHEGFTEVVITPRGGDGAVRARIAISGEHLTEQRFGTPGVSVNWATSTITHRLNRVTLSRTEMRLLSALVGAQGEPVARSELISAAWPRATQQERDGHLSVYMCMLRKRLTGIGLGDAVRTERGIGYSLHL
jgi:DNA-binding response OmpR family regulator